MSPTALPCSILPHDSADGPANMALDEALLDAVAEDPVRGILRTYGWTIPTLTLGYFQEIAEAESDPRWRDVPIVRRPTGGGAIWHDLEITYALVLPDDHPSARRGGALYRAVHGAIARILRARGLEAVPRGAWPAGEGEARPFLCFADRDAEDIVARGSKVVGSAQRRRRRAVLQHGSILFARSARTPELLGAGDLADVPIDPRGWSEALAREVPEALGLLARPATIETPILERARALERTAYRNPAWNRRR